MNGREAYCLGEPLRVGNEAVLLLDDAYVEDRWGVYRHLNVPIKFPGNPVLSADQPWEDNAISPSVIYDEAERKFRMWYLVWDEIAHRHQYEWRDWRPEHGAAYFIAYAESKDGLHWEKPRFKDKPYKTFPETNVVVTGVQKAQGGWVIPNHPSTGQPGKFMMCYRDNLPNANMALCLAYSDDGIHWREDPSNPVKTGIRDTRHNLVYDAARQRWLFFTRPTLFAGAGTPIPDGPKENFKRRAAVAIGQSPQSLGNPRCVLWPDEHDAPDYDNFLVNRVGSHFLSFATHMESPPERRTMDHLVFSSDGLHWQRLPDRVPVIGLGRQGEFDAGQASSVGPIFNVADKTYLYYCGSVFGQSARENFSSIGLAQIRRERFVAQVGKHTGGFLLTREIVVEGKALAVNITLTDIHIAGRYGSTTASDLAHQAFAVELFSSPRDGGPAPIQGYTIEECTAQPTDAVEYIITWNKKSDLSPLLGKSVYIRFYLANVGLYSFRFLK